MSLFQAGDFILHSGGKSNFLIDCDHLTNNDIAALAHFIGKRMMFSTVEAVDRGGLRLAAQLQHLCVPDAGVLIVDDVLTTGLSMETARNGREDVQGVVIFARGPYANWIRPVFVVPGRWS